MNYHDQKPNAYARALEGYDQEHRQALEEAILRAVVDTSTITEPRILCIRTGELADALVNTLAAAIALSPEATRSPASIRRVTDGLRKQIVKKVAEARANTAFQDFEARVFRDDDAKRGGRA